MAENPASWGPLEKAIHEAIRKHHEAQVQGKIGYSLPKYISEYLKGSGFVIEQRNRPKESPALHPDGYPVDEMGG